jgi:putative membrane protein
MKTISLKRLPLAVLAAGIPILAAAQDPNMNNLPAHNMPANNQSSRNLPERILDNLTAQQFVSDAAVGGIKEVRLGQMALEKSQNRQVRSFANRMVKDHSAANDKLTQIAKQDGLDLPATNLFSADDPNWKNPMVTGSEQVKDGYLLTTNVPISAYQDFKHLSSLSGGAFDQAYAQAMVADHIMTVQEFEAAQKNLTDPALRQFAAQTLPTLRMHSAMAQHLNQELTNPAMGTEPTAAQPQNQNSKPAQPASTTPENQYIK